VKGIGPTLATIWRLASPYFYSQDRVAARALLAAVVAIELSLVAINVLLNQWNNRFYNALQERNWNAFVTELLIFCALAAAFILLAVYQVYLNQWLQIRWRQWMTGAYLGKWLNGATHYRMQLLGDAADNPDQRIAEDINMFIEKILYLGLGLLNSVVTVGSFVAILWMLSASAPFTLFGINWAIPGYLVWAALIYSIAGTAITQWIGRALIGLNFMQQRYEADFRFSLVRVRESSEQIALLSGEAAERQRLLERFGRVVGNWIQIMKRTKALTFFTAGFTQVSTVFPYAVVSPAYFAGTIQLGGLMQTASAFASVQGALSFFASSSVYRQFAEWRSVIQRLAGFELAVAAAQAAAHTPPVIEVAAGGNDGAVELDGLAVNLPAGTPLLTSEHVRLTRGEPALVNGPSGSGKSTLFRAIAGIWPFGSGRIVLPKGARLMMLPQRPYFPVASLQVAVTYPAEPGSYDPTQIAEAIRAVGLPALAERLDEEQHWNRMLSLGEQQRLGIARALLQKPDYLFLDEATASLDEPAEAALYKLLAERLPEATVVSIGHRSTLAAFHRRRIALDRDGESYRLHDAALRPAAAE
jgi:vitamin B12/bleomycin/antimicrobial peptide transport system ATP-binding/permease protein